jgi:hypothetical protein
MRWSSKYLIVDTLRSIDWFIKKYINSGGGLRLAAWQVLVYPDMKNKTVAGYAQPKS